jgi:hypothetical protein
MGYMTAGFVFPAKVIYIMERKAKNYQVSIPLTSFDSLLHCLLQPLFLPVKIGIDDSDRHHQ